MTEQLRDYKFPPLKGVSAAHPWQEIHQWLCNVLGAEPSGLVVTDPRQQLQVTIDIRPLMKILGGEWADVVERAERIKLQNSQGSNKRGIVIEGEEGSFLAGLVKKKTPRPDAKEFTRSAAVALDVTQKAVEAEKPPAAVLHNENQPVMFNLINETTPTNLQICSACKNDRFYLCEPSAERPNGPREMECTSCRARCYPAPWIKLLSLELKP